MSKNFKIVLGFAYLSLLIIFLYLIFANIQINRLSDFTYYKELQIIAENFITKNFLINIFLFSIFTIVWVFLLGFGLPILLLSGILLGKWIGTIVAVFSMSLGALALYTTANFFLRETIKELLWKKYFKYIQLFQKNEFNYYFIYRIVGGLGLPFFLQNLLPVLFNMKKSNYFFSSFLGFIPSVFIFCSIGNGLNIFIQQEENFSLLKLIILPEIYQPIFMFSVLVAVSLLIKKIFFK